MVRFHPQWLRARELVRSGALGELRSMQIAFSFFNREASNIRNRPETGGGALMDIGCYAVVAGRYFFEGEPRRVVALVDMDAQFGVDRTFSALLDFGAGRHLNFTVSTQSTPYQRLHLMGTRQRLEIQIPFNAPPDCETRMDVDTGRLLGDASAETEIIAPCDQYTLQGDAFSRALRDGVPPPYGIEDAIQNMRILDALFASQRSGQWEVP